MIHGYVGWSYVYLVDAMDHGDNVVVDGMVDVVVGWMERSVERGDTYQAMVPLLERDRHGNSITYLRNRFSTSSSMRHNKQHP